MPQLIQGRQRLGWRFIAQKFVKDLVDRLACIECANTADLDTIIAGGAGFADRLKAFSEAAAAARDATAQLAQAKAEAAAMLEEATSIKEAAERQLAENQAKAEELRVAMEETENARSQLTAKLETVNAIMRD